MTSWQAAPEPLPSLTDSVHVWAVNLDTAAFDSNSWLALLSPEEQQRAARFKFAHDRRRYIVSHVAVRDILSRYLEIAGADLKFSEGKNGKPRLTELRGAGVLEFNLSHSRERALIAVSRGRIVGVDIEFVRNDFEFHDVAKHFFTQREVAELNSLPAALRRQAFYKCWTSKEAFLKAKGIGLSGALDEVRIVLSEAKRVKIGAAVDGWSLAELEPGDSYEGALAVEGDRIPINGYLWKVFH